MIGIVALLVLSRLPLLGHILTWDEAWNLGALRSLAEGNSLFIERYRVHPPLYMWLGLLLAPAAPGLALRVELFNLVLNAGALLVFIRLVASLFGRQTALYTGLAYLLLPGPLFFDTWIKRDPLITLFCLLAVACFFARRDGAAGLLLGLAMLTKETAVFYWGTVFLLVLVLRRGPGKWRALLKIFSVAIIVSGWWYITAPGWQENLHYFMGTTKFTRGHEGPWWYYFAKLRSDLGWVGLALMLAGLVAAVARPAKGKQGVELQRFRRSRYLPFFLLFPAYLVISFSHGKPAWITMVLQPPLALLVGLGWAAMARILLSAGKSSGGNTPPRFLIAVVFLVLLLGLPLAGFRYDDYLKQVSPNQYRVIETSSEIVAAVNAEVRDGERLLILPMLYRNNPAYPDPIFYESLRVSPEILRSMNLALDYRTLVSLVISKRVHWVLMSPFEGSTQEALVRGLAGDIPEAARRGRMFSVGGLFRVDTLWKGGGTGEGNAE